MADKVTPAAVTELLTYTVRGDLDNVESCLQNNPALAYAQGDITDPAGRAFENITAFQYAVWALDKEMWELCLTVLTEADAYDQLVALEDERQDIAQSHGAHFSFDSLLNAYKRYIDNFQVWYRDNNWDALDHCFCKEIGGAQKLMPAWFVYLFTEEGRTAWSTGYCLIKTFARPHNFSGYTEWYGPNRGFCRGLCTSQWVIINAASTTENYQPYGDEAHPERYVSNDADTLESLKSSRVRELAELTEQLSQAARNPSSSLRLSKQ